MATYRKRGSKWEVRINYKTDDGEYKQKSNQFATKREATRWAMEKELYTKEGLDKADTKLIAFYDNWFDIYKKPRISPRTQRSYDNSRRVISKYFGKTRLKDINNETVQKFVNAFGEGTSPFDVPHARNTVAKVYIHLHSCLKQAVKKGIYRFNPADDIVIVGSVTPKAEREKYLNESDQIKLRNYILTHTGSRNVLNYMILTALDTGMRIGEIIALQWKSISKTRIYVYRAYDYESTKDFVPTKNDNPRYVSINTELYAFLMELKSNQLEKDGHLNENGLAFKTYLGTTISPGYMDRKLKEIERKLKIDPPVTFHGLRHSHASLLLYKGVNIKAISKRLGHLNTGTTINTYSHILDEMDLEQNDKVAEIISNSYKKS